MMFTKEDAPENDVNSYEYTGEDSLLVTENDDGTLSIEWHPDDPKYSFLNTMKQEEIEQYFTAALDAYIKEIEDESDNTRS